MLVQTLGVHAFLSLPSFSVALSVPLSLLLARSLSLSRARSVGTMISLVQKWSSLPFLYSPAPPAFLYLLCLSLHAGCVTSARPSRPPFGLAPGCPSAVSVFLFFNAFLSFPFRRAFLLFFALLSFYFCRCRCTASAPTVRRSQPVHRRLHRLRPPLQRPNEPPARLRPKPSQRCQRAGHFLGIHRRRHVLRLPHRIHRRRHVRYSACPTTFTVGAMYSACPPAPAPAHPRSSPQVHQHPQRVDHVLGGHLPPLSHPPAMPAPASARLGLSVTSCSATRALPRASESSSASCITHR